MWVKICGIRTMRAALAAAEAGADAVGFIFVPGARRYVDPERVRFMGRGLPPGVERVGVFADTPPGEAVRVARLAGVTMVQLSGSEPPEYLEELPLPAIKAVRLRDDADLEGLGAWRRAAAILLEPPVPGRYGGTGVVLDWALGRAARERLRREGYAGRVLLAGGLTPLNVRAAARAVRPDGVDVSSGVETAGEKDLAKIYAFVAAARGAFPGTGEEDGP